MNAQSEWTPGVGVGRYLLGAPIQKYVDDGFLVHRRWSDIIGNADSFDDEAAGIVVFPEDDDDGNIIVPPGEGGKFGIIDSLKCTKSLQYKNKELLGISLQAVISVLGVPPQSDGEEFYLGEEDVQTTADFDDLGLILWFRDGLSVTASVMEVIEDGD